MSRHHMGGPMGRGPAEKAKDFKGTIKKLLKYMGGYKAAIIIVAVFAIASTVFAIIGPKILGGATTEIFEGLMRKISGDQNGIDFGAIGKIIIELLFLYVISAFFSYLQGFIMSGVSSRLTFRLRSDISDKIHRLPISYYDKTTTGDVLSRITNDVDVINQSFNQSITQIITTITTLIGITVMMFSISWQLTLIALVSLPVSLAFVALIVSRSQKHFLRQQKYLGNVNGQIEEFYGCRTVIKAFCGEEKSTKEFNEQNEKLYSVAWKANFFSGMMMPIMNFIGNVTYVIICIVGGYYAAQGTLLVGDIQAFIQYVRQFNQPIAQLSQISNVLQQTVAAAERVFEFLDEEDEVPDTDHPVHVDVKGAVSFKNVSFGYNPDKIIIKNFSADVKPGQKVAIVGPTGAGKTTMIKLLMRFYDVTGGEILVDGHNVKDYTRDDLRSDFGMVLQDAWAFSGTIADNIRYGRLDATDQEVIAAAKTAQVHHFVTTLPGGYNMILNEETTNVSNGQKQLLTIARAILADPKILILDEATSSVDTRTELLIQKAMDNLMQGRTSFIIAHRLSTIKGADMILVMNNGDIVEQGTHQQLLAKNGFYANLYNSQFES